eukprot:scaffold3089_cov136-Isochrysis_galbana.AAC.11
MPALLPGMCMLIYARREVEIDAGIGLSTTLNPRLSILETRAEAVVVHAALTPSPVHSGLNKEKGMGKEWGKGRGVSGRLKDKGCPVVTPLGSSAFF